MKPVFFDGLIYTMIAFFGAIASGIANDEAAKFITPAMLFFGKLICSAIAAALLALKMFRSTSYSQFVAERKAASDTAFLKRPDAPTQ
jgi:hypothetical protein